MIVVLSPAKALDFEAAGRFEPKMTAPALHAETALLMKTVRALDVGKLKALMKLSDSLARLNHGRFQSFDAGSKKPEGSRPAAFAFDGDTYVGLDARTLGEGELESLAARVRILSGLYGVLRPFDAILPYRLEMGSKLATERGKDLYAFWGDRIGKQLRKDVLASGSKVLLNCASTEYFSVVDRDALGVDVVTPVFKEKKGSKVQVVSFLAKRARGMMARFVSQQRIDDVKDVRAFSAGGYRFQPQASSESELVFLRG